MGKKQIKKKRGKWGQGVTTGLACFVGWMCMASALKKSRIEVNSVSSATSGTFDDCFVEKSVAASFDLKSQNPISILFLPLNHPINI
jgi:hypothetical protein